MCLDAIPIGLTIEVPHIKYHYGPLVIRAKAAGRYEREGANAAKAGAREDARAEGYEREGAKAAKAGAREDATAAEEDSC